MFLEVLCFNGGVRNKILFVNFVNLVSRYWIIELLFGIFCLVFFDKEIMFCWG